MNKRIKLYLESVISEIKENKYKGYEINKHYDNNLYITIYNYDIENNYFILNGAKIRFDCIKFDLYDNDFIYDNKVLVQIFENGKKYYGDMFFNMNDKFRLILSNEL